MSTEYKNSGIISANKRKRAGKRDPDITGSLDSVTCPHCAKEASYWLSGWHKENDKGRFYSLSVQPKEAKEAAATERVVVEDEDITF